MVVVITPLISLARDQVSELNERVRHELGDATAADFAAALGGAATQTDALQRALSGQYALLYVSPEAFEAVAPLLAWAAGSGRISVGAVAVDEAHCTRWASWRPAYGMVAKVLEEHLPGAPRVALTATATAEQIDEELPAACGLRLHHGDTLVGGVVRPNLATRVVVGRTAHNFRWAVLGDGDDGDGEDGEESGCLFDEEGAEEGAETAAAEAATAAEAEAVMVAEAEAEVEAVAVMVAAAGAEAEAEAGEAEVGAGESREAMAVEVEAEAGEAMAVEAEATAMETEATAAETVATVATVDVAVRPPPPTLIYFSSRKAAREGARRAEALGRRAAYYGADEGRKRRAAVERRWRAADLDVVCATIAFVRCALTLVAVY